jgi:hypothetical protein
MRFTRSKIAVLASTALIASTVIGVNISASDDDSEGLPESAVPGVPLGGDEPITESGAAAELITTNGTKFDPTILTKSIPAQGMVPAEGDTAKTDGECVFPSPGSAEFDTVVRAPVELPDGARIKRITLFGEDNHVNNISVTLRRGYARVPFIVGTPTHSVTGIGTFNTGGSSGVMAVSGPDNLNEVTGSFAGGGIIATHF